MVSFIISSTIIHPHNKVYVTAQRICNHFHGRLFEQSLCYNISTDKQYVKPIEKPIPNEFPEFVDEFEVFKILDTIKVTSAGLDGISHWFLRTYRCPINVQTGSIPL